MRFVLLLLFAGICLAEAENCPSQDPTLVSFEAEFSGIESDEDVIITGPTLLDVESVEVNTITISGTGKLVFGQGHSISIATKGILVKDNGALVIGSETCPHEDEVNIVLKGQRTADRTVLGPEGEKYIAVTDNGVLQIYGQEKLPWTKLSETAERFTDSQYASKVIFDHATSPNAGRFPRRSGFLIYKFDGTNFVPTYFDVFRLGDRGVNREQRRLSLLAGNAISAIQDGEVVAFAVNNDFRSGADLSELYTALETVAGLEPNSLLLRTADPYDAFALTFVKGGMASQSIDRMVGKEVALARATITHNGKKVTAISHIMYRTKQLNSGVRILEEDVGFPTIKVVHDISSWNVGDQVLLTSTDYAWHHGEVRTIHSIEDNHTIQLSDELDYRHFGEIEDGVDMRGEVALISRNIKFRGEMSRDCPPTNENCDSYRFDTYGGQMKAFETFGSVHIEGAEFINMGQTQDQGNYPIHFHMCRNITGKEAIIKHNSIHDSYARCVTVHGTFGSSKTDLGVQLIGNVAYNIMGHCFFLEDGAEMATSLVDNLGAGIKVARNGFATDRNKPSIYWLTNPKVIMKGNVAAGSQGFGIWYVFPLEPVGPSQGLVYRFKEARRTPVWDFDNNIVHSNEKGGMNFDNILDDENGSVVGCMNYSPKENPLDRKSADTKVQFTRLTAYKNLRINCWLRGGWFELIQFSSADSRKGLQFARGSKQQMFVKKSIFIGKSANNFESDDYPDAMTDSGLKQYLGVVFHDGPTYVQTSWFKSSKPCTDDSCVAAALGFATKNKFTSSVVSNVTDLRFAFTDPVEGNRVFDGVVDQTSLGMANFDGDETATFRDTDGSVTRCASDTAWSYPTQVVTPEKYLLTDSCTYRENWALASCRNKFGKLKARASARWSGDAKEFENSGSMKRVTLSNPTDTAVENHLDQHTSEYMVVLGDDSYYYQFQFTDEFPKDMFFEARGVERDADVIVGICLPEGATRDDMSIMFRSPNNIFQNEFVFVDHLDDVRSDEDMKRVFLDGRFLYFKFTSRLVRDDRWEQHDSDHCPGNFCPVLHILMNRQLSYSPCFTPTARELSNVTALSSTAKETCNLGTASPDPDWGVGDTFGSHDGQWGEWSGWAECCNDGTNTETTTRYRLCDNPTKLGDGADCVGESTESKLCETSCPVDGVTGAWTDWSACFCDGIAEGSRGAKVRSRTCSGTANGGQYCSVGVRQVGNCRGNCVSQSTGDPVAGTRTNWSEWTNCFCDGIASGSTGVKTRSRSCEGTANGGRICTGIMDEVRTCKGDCGYN